MHQPKLKLVLNHSFRIIGYLLLSGIVLFLFVSTSIEAWKMHSIGGIFAIIVLVGTFTTIVKEGIILFISEKLTKEKSWHKIVLEFLAVFFGGLISYFFSQDIGLGPVVAASLVAIIAHLVTPELDVPVYCGAFVGMTSEILLFTHFEVAIASLISSLIFIMAKGIFTGIGGKLGSMALLGTATVGVVLGRDFLYTPISDWKTNAIVILIALIAAPLTFYFNRYRGNGPVLASAVVGISAGLILPTLFPTNGNQYAVVAICASFTGMTGKDRCPNFWHMLIAGLFTGTIFVFSTPLLGGAGGKLGTIAFGSALSACGYSHIFQWIKRRQRTER